MKPRLPSRHSRSQLSELRRLLRSEAKTLVGEYERASKAQQEVLQRVLKAVERSDDAVLMSELPALRRDVEIARRALARLSLAGQSTEKLRTEWNDWERHAAYVDDAVHTAKRERQEMIASELRTRGVRLPSQAAQESLPVAAVSSDEVVTEEGECLEISSPAPVIEPEQEAFQDEPEIEGGSNEEQLAYWDALIASLQPESLDERALARLLGAYRRVQGARKRQDRQTGTRRYRVGAFDAWS